MVKSKDIIDLHIGVLAIFSFGFYILPIWFRDFTELKNFNEQEVINAELICFIFSLFIMIGVQFGKSKLRFLHGINNLTLDFYFNKKLSVISFIAFIFYLYYYFTQSITSYIADDFTDFFENRDLISGLFGVLSDLSLAIIGFSIAYYTRSKELLKMSISLIYFFICLAILLTVGQRSALISPILMLVTSFAVTRQFSKAYKIIILSIIVLSLISPLAVFIRESIASKNATNSENIVKQFDYGSNPFEVIFVSILDRSDILYVIASLKDKIDDEPLPGVIYYSSILLNPIPRVLFPNQVKPYPLSVNGQQSGELSSYAWNIIVGPSIGSLTAFGGIVAYRELRWFGVVLNGFLTGVFFYFLSKKFANGGELMQLIYITIFPAIALKRVPPSLFESILAFNVYIPFIIFILLINKLVERNKVV
jgi:oligosaccharide repeat unit polymerase